VFNRDIFMDPPQVDLFVSIGDPQNLVGYVWEVRQRPATWPAYTQWEPMNLLLVPGTVQGILGEVGPERIKGWICGPRTAGFCKVGARTTNPCAHSMTGNILTCLQASTKRRISWMQDEDFMMPKLSDLSPTWEGAVEGDCGGHNLQAASIT